MHAQCEQKYIDNKYIMVANISMHTLKPVRFDSGLQVFGSLLTT